MADNNQANREKEKEDDNGVDGVGGPVIIPTAAAAFVGALVGAVIGSQMS